MKYELGITHSQAEPVPPQRHPNDRVLFTERSRLGFALERLSDFATGDLLVPRFYEIESYHIPTDELRSSLNADGLFEGIRGKGESIAPTVEGFMLNVNGYFNNVQGRHRKTRYLRMMAIGDTGTKSMEIYNGEFRCWIHLGYKHFVLSYQQTEDQGIAELAEVRRMFASDIPGLFTSARNPVKPERAEKMKFVDLGFPKRVDWVKTLRMYVNRLVPDASGNFTTASRELIAEDIYKQALVPAN